jgi:hypothetical protein
MNRRLDTLKCRPFWVSCPPKDRLQSSPKAGAAVGTFRIIHNNIQCLHFPTRTEIMEAALTRRRSDNTHPCITWHVYFGDVYDVYVGTIASLPAFRSMSINGVGRAASTRPSSGPASIRSGGHLRRSAHWVRGRLESRVARYRTVPSRTARRDEGDARARRKAAERDSIVADAMRLRDPIR